MGDVRGFLKHDRAGTAYRPVAERLDDWKLVQQDFDAVCKIIGKPRRKLPHVNKGDRAHYSEYFDEDCRQLFLRHFAKDVELFGY